jgi:hypothetical protein
MPDAEWKEIEMHHVDQAKTKSDPSTSDCYIVGLKRPPSVEAALQDGQVLRTASERQSFLSLMQEHSDNGRQRIEEWARVHNLEGSVQVVSVLSALGQVIVRCPETVVKQLEADLSEVILGVCQNVVMEVVR